MSFLQESLFYSSFSWDPFSSRFADTCHKIEFTLLFFLTYLPWSLQLSWCLTFLLTAITPATCQGYTYYLPVNMGKCWSLSKLRYSITYQSRNLCLLENVNGKSAELKTGVCEWNLRTLFLKKKKSFFNHFSPWGKRIPHFAICFALQSRNDVYIYIFGILQHTIQGLFEGGQGQASYGLTLLCQWHWQGEEFMLHYANALQVSASC